MRWVVAFNGSRDGYQVAVALQEAHQLERLVTDWYSPFDRAWFRAATRAMPEAAIARLRRRHHPSLPSDRVETLTHLALRDAMRPGRPSDMDARIGARAGVIARRRAAGLLSYSYYAYHAFRASEGVDLPRVIFQVHPHPASLRTLFIDEMDRVPEARTSLAGEAGLTLTPTHYAEVCEEPRLADLCIASSGYTRRTLIENGVDAERIRVVPYGVDLEWYRPPAEAPRGPFRVLFVGQMVQRKGLSYLLEAWRRLRLPNAELVLAGHGMADDALLAEAGEGCTIRRAVSRAELRHLYQTSDVFCMPSLAEGFGLVYLEALACGTPVIATPNTGAADLVTPGVDGFVHRIRDVDALAGTLRWLYEHPGERREMRVAARRLAERHGWPAFRDAIRDALGAVDAHRSPGAARGASVTAVGGGRTRCAS